jgi:hypothetical protein
VADRLEDDPLLASLVASADEGAIGLWLVVGVVRSVRAELSEGEDDEARGAVLALVGEALRRRLLIAGEVEDGAFEAWHLSPEDAVERIDREWRALGRDPQPGEIATLATPGRLGYA